MKIELLAPARSAEIGIEAINHGADAVYIGGPSFGARVSAGNSVADLARLCEHAHKFNAKIFVTLNTILRDDELEPARKLASDMYEAGVDVLIVQDMAMLDLDIPPIQLHASTQTDIRTPEKALFLQDVGFSQAVLARELTLKQIRAIRAATDPARFALEFFIHGALCVAYSGQCFISHAHTGRSANRGDCSQACRLPYKVQNEAGQIIAHDKHVLSMKDNNQSDNLEALIDAGITSFKVEGRYKDMGYVKNITAHYRKLLDELFERRPELSAASDGKASFTFTPDPNRNFNRSSTDYFVNGRKEDIGAFDTPKYAGIASGFVTALGKGWFEMETSDTLHNGDGLTYFDLQQELVGMQANVVQELAPNHWRVFPDQDMRDLPDLRNGTSLHRNRDMSWNRALEKKSAGRRIGAYWHVKREAQSLLIELSDENGLSVSQRLDGNHEVAKDADKGRQSIADALGKLGTSDFVALGVSVDLVPMPFIPASVLNAARRDLVTALIAKREAARERPQRAYELSPPVPYPEENLSYLANVFNQKAHDFYARHGVKVIEAAYESQEELGEVSLMITKHCVRFSMSLCPKQAKGVQGVQGTIRAEPLTLINGSEKLTLKFDCKPCEMHVVGKMKPAVLRMTQELEPGAQPVAFFKTGEVKRTARAI